MRFILIFKSNQELTVFPLPTVHTAYRSAVTDHPNSTRKGLDRHSISEAHNGTKFQNSDQ